jgi:beta-mannosidase
MSRLAAWTTPITTSAVSLPLTWEVGHAATPDQVPGRFVPAVVPGAVQLDWARAEGWPEYWKGNHFRDYRWMEDAWWTYRTQVPAGIARKPDQRLVFSCGGVDYHFSVYFEGRKLFEHEGMFSPFELDLTELAPAGGRLEIRLRPAPKAPSPKEDQKQVRRSVKPAVSYGWDWHPRLIPLGVWQETTLSLRPAARVLDAEVRYELDVEHRSAKIEFQLRGTAPADGLEWGGRLISPAGAVVAEVRGLLSSGTGRALADVGGLELWWPHDQGAQSLYRAEFELRDRSGVCVDGRSERVGFRRVRLVMHEGAWDEPVGFPKSRSHPPMTVEINGRPVFCRGTNWVPPEIFPGIITADTYRPLLQLAREANFNLLRSWGGGIVNKAPFFEQCDELGLMVWQEFPLACNNYEDDPAYLRVLDAESRAILHRLRRHPCLALWSGGNELFNSWSGMTDQSLALRLLNRNCYDLDPSTPFIPTSPLDGVAHGDYRFRDDTGREVHQIYSSARHTAYPEFGCPGPAPVEYLKKFIPPEELWPPAPGTTWETHHAFKAWQPEQSWLFRDVIEFYFGRCDNLATLVGFGDWLQGEGYKAIYEEARRQKPRCAMALNWCYNEPWPTAANNSIVNWPAQAKPAFRAVAAACRPVLASARIPKFAWQPGEEFRAELWLLNDSPEAIPAGRIVAWLDCGGRSTELGQWQHGGTVANRHLAGPEIRAVLPVGARHFALRLVAEGQPGWDSVYPMPFALRAAP